MKNILFAAVVLMCHSIVTAQSHWQSLNPGAGGRVQGLSCDPTVPGRMYVASDMEGFYYSDDYGTSWNWEGKGLPTAFILMSEGRGDKMLCGHAKGLSVKYHEGDDWHLVSDTYEKTIGVIEFDDQDTTNIYAGINWRGNDGHLSHYPQEFTDTQEIYVSRDGGVTWTPKSWSSFAEADPRVFSITVNRASGRNNEVIITTVDGMYLSTDYGDNWTKIDGPTGIAYDMCTGADLTVDGQWLYAMYRKDGRSKLFVKDYLNDGAWQDLGHDNWAGTYTRQGVVHDRHMWQPKVFQSTGNNHYVLIAQRDQNPNEGLYEGSFVVNPGDGTVSGSYEVIMNHDGTNASVTYDFGWNYYVANCRNNTYYPAEWTGTDYTRGVFTQAQQSYFTGDAADGNEDWRVVSTGFVKKQNGIDFYRSRGTASTFTYDVAVHENYMIQGQADNLALESWDNGGSWVQTRTGFGVQDGHAVHMLPTNPPIVLMNAAAGFGGGNPAANASLLYKTITSTGK